MLEKSLSSSCSLQIIFTEVKCMIHTMYVAITRRRVWGAKPPSRWYQCRSRNHLLRDQDRDQNLIMYLRPRPAVYRDLWFETETSSNRDRDRQSAFDLFKMNPKHQVESIFLFSKKLKLHFKYTKISIISEESIAHCGLIISSLPLKIFSSGAEEAGTHSVLVKSVKRAGNSLLLSLAKIQKYLKARSLSKLRPHIF